MEPIPLSKPSVTSYGNFLFKIAALMPVLQDRSSQAPTLNAKYEQVLHCDKLMRELVLTQLPPCLNSQTPLDPSWPPWVSVARRFVFPRAFHLVLERCLFKQHYTGSLVLMLTTYWQLPYHYLRP